MLLKIDNLSIKYHTPSGIVDAVRNVSLSVETGKTLAIAGESGCGKSTLAYALMGHLATNGQLVSGGIHFHGKDIFNLSKLELTKLRGKRISMVHQNPLSTLNPILKIGTQIAEVIHYHGGLSARESREQAIEYLELVNMPDPGQVFKRYPHELSGGQCQRVSIAMALCMNPDLIIMDEPTTALDVTTEVVVLDLLEDLKKKINAGIIYISHDMGVIARVSDNVAVMYAGEIIEEAQTKKLFKNPMHPYTRRLMGCVIKPGLTKKIGELTPIPGAMPKLISLSKGCNFADRCDFTSSICNDTHPKLEQTSENHMARCLKWKSLFETNAPGLPSKISKSTVTKENGDNKTILNVKALYKSFKSREGGRWWSQNKKVQAVVDVSLKIPSNHILGLVGESGSGKTTLLRSIIGLENVNQGEILLGEDDISMPLNHRSKSVLDRTQVVFQDPESTLNPKYTIGNNLLMHLRCLQGGKKGDQEYTIHKWLKMVKLDSNYFYRYPSELSGGEKQRVAIARAFLGNPELILCDEPLSALDVSVQASVLQLLIDLQESTGVSFLMISHDLTVVRYLADSIAVMYLGRILEIGDVESFNNPPYHPYTEALLSAMSWVDQVNEPIRLTGTIPSPIDPPKGCVFYTRCPKKLGDICETKAPPWNKVGGDRDYCCHILPSDFKNSINT
jgi:peptide/nickel transport system ATP-binding protein